MAEVKWIKIVTDVFDDEKLILIESMPEADSIIVIWFKLLCLAGKQNRDGLLMLNNKIAYTDEMLATVFRRPINTVRLALNTFERFAMIEIVDGTICIANWEKHQNAGKLAEMREYNRIAQQKSRARRRLLPAVNDMSMTSQECQSTDIDIEEDKEEEKKENKRKIFSPPTLEEVVEYAKQRNSNVNPKDFFDFFEAGEWVDSKGEPVRNWKQKFLTWENMQHNKTRKSAKAVEQQYSESDLQRYRR